MGRTCAPRKAVIMEECFSFPERENVLAREFFLKMQTG